MPAIFPISTTRISDVLLQRRILSQFEFDQSQLVRIQDQVSTGLRLSVGSDDAPAARRAMTLQRILEQKQQVASNLASSQSFLGASDNALNGASDILLQIRAEVLGVVGTTASDTQRQVVAQEVYRSIERLVEIGNRQFRGRFLFAGSTTHLQPFAYNDAHVIYDGNEGQLLNRVDLNTLFETNVTGQDAFGAISAAAQGTADLNPVITADSRLADLNAGAGVTRGSFLISDGQSTKAVDISAAETLADVVRIIEANAPEGRTLTVRLSSQGLLIDIDDAGGGNLTVVEQHGGTTARELGILNSAGVGVGTLVGTDLNQRLLPTTPLGSILGTRASAVLPAVGPHNDLVITASQNGAEFSGVQIQFTSGTAAGDQALVNFDPANKLLTIDISPSTTTANTVVDAINQSGFFTAELDRKFDTDNEGVGVVDVTTTATTQGGSGIVFDQDSGIQIVNGGETFSISFAGAETVEDVLNILNRSDANVVAQINASGSGIDIRSKLSGADFRIGENGGTTATELGIRTLDRETRLQELNYGRGVDSADGVDFSIQRKDGTVLDVDISGAQTVGDVLDLVNNHVDNTGSAVVAELASFGNGIVLRDPNALGPELLQVSKVQSSSAADLGLMDASQFVASATPGLPATATVSFAPPEDQNTGITVTSAQVGAQWNQVRIEFQPALAGAGDVANATFDAATSTLRVDIDPGQTTAATVIAEITANTPFAAQLDLSQDPTNDGTGSISATGILATTSGGADETLHGLDTNSQETQGLFTALLRLGESVEAADLPQIERAMAMLDEGLDRLNNVRAELGARGSTLDAVERRLENEDVQLQAALSNEIDADLVHAISDLAARQANLQATLQLVGRTMQLTVLDFV